MVQAMPPPAPADADIIESVRLGDVQAYGMLVERYERSVLAVAFSVLRDMHGAQDVVQDVFVHCYLKLGGLRDGSRFSAWLMKTAQRAAMRASRKRKPAITLVTDVPSDAAAFPEDHEQLLAAVNRLPEHERTVVGLRFFDGHSVAEIAAMTSRPIGTVTKQLSRALKRLRDQMRSEIESCPAIKSANS